jgi:hypothetical protein
MAPPADGARPRKAFAAIGTVEGIRMTSEMKRRAAEFDRTERSKL